ncbi:preprotein translocase subunit SecG [Thermomonas sp. RSS23]|jgi:preprotein translocase subunit SecG|uniref:Protein-export membrane protein SecG n=1 Tax=Thermomonas beijingensis TaxID=2872701 RepID=A0ABS7TEA3_9GAMM|nr:preprotein translocase subunit SecG [Thermomonas beijingensis]MBZ4186160.1 preprotein translocase subunit SecG [Thermomonas beijingensis]
MLLQLVNILYVLVAIGIIAFVLLQQGSGAQAGSGFGGGASSTVFGARGASNFLSKSTKWLAIVFFVTSMGMAMYASKQAVRGPAKVDLGVMAQQPATKPAPSIPTAPAQSAPTASVVAPPVVQTTPAATTATVAPAAPTAAPKAEQPAAPAPAK